MTVFYSIKKQEAAVDLPRYLLLIIQSSLPIRVIYNYK